MFDTISHKSVLDKLQNVGIRGLCHCLFKSYLVNRLQVVKIDNIISELKTVLYGYSIRVLAHIMFIMDLNGMLTLDTEGKIISFADDTDMFFTGISWYQIQDTVKKELKIINDWFDESLTINMSKTNYLPFCSYRDTCLHLQKQI